MLRRVTIALLLLAALLSPTGGAEAAFGDAWSEVGTDVFPVVIRFHTTARFGDTLYVMGGQITPSATISAKVYSSTDAESWSEVGTDVLPTSFQRHCTVVFDGSLWVIGGFNRDTVVSSSDGSSWSEVGTNALPHEVYDAACAVLGGKIHLIGGQDADNDHLDTVYASEDGETWTQVGTLPQPVASARAEVLDGTIYLVGGTDSSDDHIAKVFSSEDGETWAELGTDVLPSPRSQVMTGVAGGQLWLAGGRDDPAIQSDVYTSSNGENWSEIGDDAFPAERQQAGTMPLFNGKLHVIGGQSSSGPTQTVYATDDIAGAAALPEDDDAALSGAGDISALGDQSGDTGQANLPVLGPIAQEVETDTGYPVLKFVWVLIAGTTIIGAGLLMSLVAQGNPVLPAIAVIAMTALWWQVGQGDIVPWAVLVSVAFATIGITTFTTRTPA